MEAENIELFLAKKIGFDANILGSKTIAKAVEKRRLACNLPNLETYLELLQTSLAELEELIEELIVPETWFFRDGEPFSFLARYVKSEWLPAQTYRPLRLLSIPCSSGEEPYSMAMALLDAGLTPNQFRIDGVDISKKALLKAKTAIYTRNSFRGNNLDFRKQYFNQIGDEYQLCDLVKNTVTFIKDNLITSDLLTTKPAYDVIFCRNVLIYFDSNARKMTLQNLNRLLANQGLLFVGFSETAQLLELGFESVRQPSVFAYRKQEKTMARLQPAPSRQELSGSTPSLLPSNLSKKSENSPSETIKPIQTLRSSPQNILSQNKLAGNSDRNFTPTHSPNTTSSLQNLNLETIRCLADKGHLSEATTLCETYLKQNYTCVEAYVLLGQIYQANGLETQAEQCFQKAIYLEPNHYEALLHLTLLKEQRGEMAKVTVLRQRIERLQQS